MRYLKNEIDQVLKRKMVFIGGPRQVGKTTFCLSFLEKKSPLKNPAYLNWDDVNSRSLIKSGELPDKKIICLDEIHKFKNWRSLVKGFFDVYKEHHQFLVTGSARLDHYRKGGDSLLGRYRYFRLHPFSLSELGAFTEDNLNQLLKFGGFPEPLFLQSEKELRLWQKERLYRVVHDDIRDLERVKEITSLELLAEALPPRVGSPLSINSLSGDLEAHHQTVEKWTQILENIYYCFRISSFLDDKIRPVKKEKKLFLWDWSLIPSEGIRFENLVANQLLKYCHYLEDTEGYKMELKFIRDIDQREVDFIVLKDKKPLFAVECKTGDSEISKHIEYFAKRIKYVPVWYQVHRGQKDKRIDKNIRMLPFVKFCQELNMP
ncbi:MAG: ATP-binding protein [Pseudobdellovibrionaceae bacterium]